MENLSNLKQERLDKRNRKLRKRHIRTQPDRNILRNDVDTVSFITLFFKQLKEHLLWKRPQKKLRKIRKQPQL